ncbi:hypothetical protein SADUNF_Sadunf02G0102000 [Salix dunnii]|uniref:Uncharacterized protein n=1 Tax=Salix dunnii TaxID=1413687 RepID=A0A835N775_9ROSI|nr:hypothetical protein SADUNF_Sadunf02G0102000 [Salix dunnii]
MAHIFYSAVNHGGLGTYNSLHLHATASFKSAKEVKLNATQFSLIEDRDLTSIRAQAKDTLVDGIGAERTRKITYHLAEKGAKVKDTLVERVEISTLHVAEKGSRAKYTIVEGALKTSEHTTE